MIRKIQYFVVTFFILGWVLASNSFAAVTAPPTLAGLLPKILPSVVNIHADIKITDIATLIRIEKESGAQFNNGAVPDTFLSVASGVIVDADKGYIITNAHVVADAQTVVVTLSDGRHYNAKTIGIDKPSDVAVLQIKAKNLIAMPIANSNQLKVGDFVAAIGNPYGLNQSVTSGIVSALGRSTLGIENFENFIQIDAPINPGNSGGALINADGQLVGINTAILAPNNGNIGIGFAIPSDMVKSIMQQLIQFGDVRRGALGIGAQDITPDLQTAFNLKSVNGAVVTLVKIDSPAKKAGLTVGDIITSINNSDIKNANDVVNAIGFLRMNSKVNIAVLRSNKPVTLTATLTDPKQIKDTSQAADPFFYGVALKNFSLLSPLHGQIRGVLVVSLEQDSNAWQADMRPGDVVISANQTKVQSVEELQKAAANTKDALLLNVLRGAGAVFIVINKEVS